MRVRAEAERRTCDSEGLNAVTDGVDASTLYGVVVDVQAEGRGKLCKLEGDRPR